MDFETFISKLRKQIRNSYHNIGETMLAGGVTDIEKYKYYMARLAVGGLLVAGAAHAVKAVCMVFAQPAF